MSNHNWTLPQGELARSLRSIIPHQAIGPIRSKEETATATLAAWPQRVLVIDNYDSFVYILVQYLGELGAEPSSFAMTPAPSTSSPP